MDFYRFSISWSRVMPDGEGRINPAGLAFYRNLVARLKQYGISPAVTLYHWDLPQKLQNQGGWTNRKAAYAFRAFAEVMFEALGDDVDVWITHNEPYVAAFMGHATGRFAPGHTDVSEALLVSHHILLSHGLAVASFRRGNYRGKIGITLDYYPAEPVSDGREDALAAQRDRESHLGWFADPIYRGCYPEMMWSYYQQKGLTMPRVSGEDLHIIAEPIDFLGRYLRYLNDTYSPGEILITENGFSAVEAPDRYGRVPDTNRIDYLYRHLEQCILASGDGVPIGGYYVWSFLDDLEWTGGHGTRMGLVRVDYDTMQRTIKDSGYWYQRVIRGRRLVD